MKFLTLIFYFIILILAVEGQFNKYPHNKVFTDYLEWGYWNYNSTISSINNDTNYMQLNMSVGNYDRIQSQALKDGIFVPIKKKEGMLSYILYNRSKTLLISQDYLY